MIMKPFSSWPIRICLAGVGGLAIGASLLGDLPTPLGQGTTHPLRPTLLAQEDDRGSGRLRQRPPNYNISFRGSGRIQPDPRRPDFQAQATSMAYRGSGRIQPLDPARA